MFALKLHPVHPSFIYEPYIQPIYKYVSGGKLGWRQINEAGKGVSDKFSHL